MDNWEGLDDDWFLKNFDLEPLDVEDLQDMANRNSYDILINRRKLSDIVDEGMALAHNPEKLVASRS